MANTDKKKINLGQVYGNVIHRPTLNGVVMYKTNIEGESENKTNDELLKSEKYIKSPLNNSPSNVRRLWIACGKVAIEYYAGYSKSSGQSSELLQIIDVPEMSQNVVQEWLDWKNFEQTHPTPSSRSMIPEGVKVPTKVEFNSTDIQGFVRPWIFNNVEEVYFDFTGFLTQTGEGVLLRNGTSSFNEIAKYFATKGRSGDGTIQTNDIPINIFAEKGITNNYKRLKCVGYVSNLLAFLSTPEVFKRTVETYRLDKPVKKSKLWVQSDSVGEIFKKTQSTVFVSFSSVANEITNEFNDTNFSIKNYYTFDNEVLKVKLEKYSAKLKEKFVDNLIDNIDKIDESADDARGAIEKRLYQIKDETNENFMKFVLKAAVMRMTRKFPGVWGAVFKEMSATDNKYFSDLAKN